MTDSNMTGGTKGRNWSITINNPTQDDYTQIEVLKSKGWLKEWTGQLERGENGTPHIQACIKTDNVKFSMIKKALPRAHIEVARNAVALRQYVVKPETRIGQLAQIRTAGLPEIQREIVRIVMENLQHKGNWCHYKPSMYDSRKKMWSFTKIVMETEMEVSEVVDMNWCYLEQMKNNFYENAINNLIRTGYYAVEIIASNPFMRNSIIKYFDSIIIRTYNAQENSTAIQASGASGQGDAQETPPEID